MKKSYRGGIGPAIRRRRGLREQLPLEEQEMLDEAQQPQPEPEPFDPTQDDFYITMMGHDRAIDEAKYRFIKNAMYVLLLVCTIIGLVIMFSYCDKRECTLWSRFSIFAFPFLIVFTIGSLVFLSAELLSQIELRHYDYGALGVLGLSSAVGIGLSSWLIFSYFL